MIEDLNALADGQTLETDLCIVGAGAAGLLIAHALLQSGLRIVLLESGGWQTDGRISKLSDGQADAGQFRGLQAGRSRVFGGTTTLWGGQCIRLDPIDFEARPWVPHSGWPIGLASLAPFYKAAEAVLDMTGPDVETPAWERFGVEPLAFDTDLLRQIHGVFIRQPNLARRFRSELGAARSVRVLLRATVQQLLTNAYGSQIDGVAVASLDGKTATVRARRVVLCAGAIENARLLLLSNSVNPNGLGNAHDQVGRYLQDHPCGDSAIVQTAAPRRLQDHWNMLYGRGTRYLPKIALTDAAQRRENLLNCVGRLAYDYDETSGTRALLDLLGTLRAGHLPRGLGRRLGQIGGGLPDIAESLWRVGIKGLSPAPPPRRIRLEVFSEQTPNPESRMTLDRATDAFGLRQVRIDWKLDALTGRTMARFTSLVGQEFERLGLGRLQLAGWIGQPVPRGPDVVDSYHPAGTTRMARMPHDGVVDTDCQVFGVHGLYVAGSAVFPTSGAANPTLTIAAMALRLAGRLKEVFAQETAAPQSAPRQLVGQA